MLSIECYQCNHTYWFENFKIIEVSNKKTILPKNDSIFKSEKIMWITLSNGHVTLIIKTFDENLTNKLKNKFKAKVNYVLNSIVYLNDESIKYEL